MRAQCSSERERAAEGKSDERRNLPRLHPSAYRGLAHVHWIFTIRDRQRGYLTNEFFLRFQLIAAHAFLRHSVASPCVCLMPDHMHLLLIGTSEEKSDQRLAVNFLRQHLSSWLSPFQFQRAAYDHVLREGAKSRQEFRKTADYITENPVRADLCETASAWPFSTAIVPGYPDLDLNSEDY